MAKSKRKSRRGPALTAFARSLGQEWRRLDLPASRTSVLVAVSGGADSLALLLALDELIKARKLKLKLIVGHLDHELRKDSSKSDRRWVAKLGKKLGYETVTGSTDVGRLAARTRDNLEQAARRARYEFLLKAAKKTRAPVILTAHTMDDQAETVLLNLLRGSGMDGLGGMEPIRVLDQKSGIVLGRPLLSWARRQETEDYCRGRGVEFLTDEMNVDEKFARVRVRRRLLPMMESFNPNFVARLAGTAGLMRDDANALERAAGRLLELASEDGATAVGKRKAPPRLRIEMLVLAHPALRRRALRQWINEYRGDLKRLGRAHILAVESLLAGDRGGRVIELPGGPKIVRRQKWLHFAAD